jgi:uncharacterized protein YndB with AHSA1/START domain
MTRSSRLRPAAVAPLLAPAAALAALLALSAPVAGAGEIAVSKQALMTFEGSVRIAAPAADVWKAMTDADKAVSWCPLWKNAESAEPLTRLGASIDFLDQWENPGRSVVVFVDPERELRLAHVPDDGSYVCQVKLQLTPAGEATDVHVTEQYSDALDAPVEKDTAAMMKREIAGYLEDLRHLAEE